jgi:hypothetical protein
VYRLSTLLAYSTHKIYFKFDWNWQWPVLAGDNVNDISALVGHVVNA